MRLVAQRRAFDCGVACAAMTCHVDYEDAYFVARHTVGQKFKTGLTMRELAKVTAILKNPLTPKHFKKVDLEDDCGILGVLWPGPKWVPGHWVVLRRGTIIDPHKSAVWDAEDYMKNYKARPGWLLAEPV